MAASQVEIEANCANDNPLIDADNGEVFHTGNFLAQYAGVAMDQLRFHIGLEEPEDLKADLEAGFARLREAMEGVRDQLSGDTWRVFANIDRWDDRCEEASHGPHATLDGHV